jgi:hypothetical protein
MPTFGKFHIVTDWNALDVEENFNLRKDDEKHYIGIMGSMIERIWEEDKNGNRIIWA